ncbi:MAG TPA: FAD-dependent oxidoreductase [Xanthobacteraceae bacterium]|nr:FAD-dependent oxidoreductase [Xanthobacteraceae bacterium]
MAKEFDIVIAGGGIAGMSAAVTSARLGRSTLILTGEVFGGQLLSIEKIDGLPGYPDGIPGYDLCPIMQDQASAAGAEFMMSSLERLEARNKTWHVATGEGDVTARGVIIATGSALKTLDVPGEKRLAGSGVSQCATCDAPLLRGRIVTVVGGGDSALQEALTLAEFATKVIILHRGGALAGQAYYRDRVTAHAKIEIRPNTVVTEILGEATVSGVRTQDASGVTSDIEAAAVFAYVGLQPNTAVLDGLVRVNNTGCIPTDASMRTELAGLCAAGNVRALSAGRAASAAGDGTSAAVALDHYLADGSWRDGQCADASAHKSAAAAHG